MKHPLKRYLFSILIPPAVGSIVFTSSMFLSPYPNPLEYLGALAFIYLYAFVLCFIPGSLFFLAQEHLAKRHPNRFAAKRAYITTGGGLGFLCGLLIGIFFGAQALFIFTPIGIAAGALTSWINFPHPTDPK